MRRLVHPAVLGFVPPKRVRRPAKAPQPTPAELCAEELERAFRCGARYSCCNWRRREPPRFRGLPPGHPGFAALLDLCRAFYRGYDAATRARYAHGREWADPLQVDVYAPKLPAPSPPRPSPAGRDGAGPPLLAPAGEVGGDQPRHAAHPAPDGC